MRGGSGAPRRRLLALRRRKDGDALVCRVALRTQPRLADATLQHPPRSAEAKAVPDDDDGSRSTVDDSCEVEIHAIPEVFELDTGDFEFDDGGQLLKRLGAHLAIVIERLSDDRGLSASPCRDS